MKPLTHLINLICKQVDQTIYEMCELYILTSLLNVLNSDLN